MGVFSNECDIYFGTASAPITALTLAASTFGTLITNSEGRYAMAAMGASSVIRRTGPEPDAFDTFDFGVTIPQITLQPRDVSQTTLNLLFASLVNTGYVSTSVGNFGKLTPKVQLWLKSLSNSLELFAPSCAISPAQSESILSWARGESQYAGQPLTFLATRPPGQTTPACVVGTNSQLTGVYFGG